MFTINLLLIPLMEIKNHVSNIAEAYFEKKGGIMVKELT